MRSVLAAIAESSGVGGCLLLVEVVHAEERTVQPDVFGTYGKVDCLVQRFCRGGHAGAGNLSPVAEGEEAELLLLTRAWVRGD